MNLNTQMSEHYKLNGDRDNSPHKKSDRLFLQPFPINEVIDNYIPSGIAIIDGSGKQVFVNQSFCRMVGWDEGDLLGIYPPFPYWSSEDAENIERAFSQTLENKAPKEGFELIFLHKTGEPIFVNVLVSTIVQGDDHKFFLANITDLTKRKKLEQHLSESMMMLSASIDSLKDTIIFSTDGEYRYTYFNKVHRDVMKYAYNADIKAGMSILGFISSDNDRLVVKENVDHAMSGESTTFIQTFGNVNRDYYECYFNPILNDENEVIGCSVLAKNINDRIFAENALRDSETKFREIINQINDIIVVFDRHGKIIIWNKGAEQVCGLEAKDALNKDIIDIEAQLLAQPANDRSRIEKIINGILTQETPEVFNRILESEIIQANSGTVRNIQSMIFPISLDSEVLFCTVVRDTTELKRYEKEILRVSAEKDKFYSMIAQYLYTPFNVFNNFTKLMAEELDNMPVKEIQRMVTMMSKSAGNVYSLLDNLLQWTKVHQGKIPFQPQVLNLKKICIEGTSVLKQDAESKNIVIRHNTTDEIYVSADIYMLKTIFRNLVYYAIRFCDESGQIDINARNGSSHVTISILSRGSGLNSDYLKKLFETRQIHSAPGHTEEQGTILGLLLCREFIEKNGGEIWVERRDESEDGINFTIPVAGKII